MAKTKEKEQKKVHVKLLVILASGLLLCTLVLLIIPTGSNPVGTRTPNEIDRKIEISRAADEYLVAGTFAERQAAARNVRAVREGSRSKQPLDATKFYSFLRVIAYITIVLLSAKILAITYTQHKAFKLRQT